MSKRYDPQIEALISDLESAIASFDQRLGNLPPEPQANAAVTVMRGEQFPAINPDARRSSAPAPAAPPTAPAAASPPPPPPPASDLLEELAKAATQSSASQTAATEARLAAARQIDAALHQVFEYFDRFCKHVNVLRPSPPVTYSLDARHQFGAVQWAEGRTDLRHHSVCEQQLLGSVTLRARFACSPLEVNVPQRNVDALRREILMLNLKLIDDVPITQRGHDDVRLLIAGEIPLQLNFGADLERHRIVLRMRNLLSLGLGAFALDPAAVDRALLDGFGRCLLGQSRQLPRALVALPFNAPQG